MPWFKASWSPLEKNANVRADILRWLVFDLIKIGDMDIKIFYHGTHAIFLHGITRKPMAVYTGGLGRSN